MQDAGRSLRRKTLRRNRKLVRSRSNVRDGILPIVARLRFLVSGLVLARELHPGAGNRGAIWIDNRPVDGPRKWRVGKLRAQGRIVHWSGFGLAMLWVHRGGSLWSLSMGRKGAKQGQEISGGERFLWKSQLLFYNLPADFQQVFTAPGKSHCR